MSMSDINTWFIVKEIFNLLVDYFKDTDKSSKRMVDMTNKA